MKAKTNQRCLCAVLVVFLYHVHFKAHGETGWYKHTVVLIHWLWKPFLLTWSLSETNHLQILLGICFIYVVAILVYKDQNSPSSWQWLTRFEFGSFAGVSLTIKLTKRLNSYTLRLYSNSAHFTPFCALLRDIVSCEYFAKAAVLIFWTSVSYFHTVREIADISLRSSLTICSIISQRNKVLYAAKRRLPK